MPPFTSQRASAAVRLEELSGSALPAGVYRGRTAVEVPRRLASEVAAFDALLGGGLPRGRVSELSGPLSSGKTSLLLALFAAATRRGEVVACVDLADGLHPASVVAAGADPRRLLWVRPSSPGDGMRCTELLLQAGGFGLVALDLGAGVPRGIRSHVWPRFLRAAEQSRSALLILASRPLAGSIAALSLRVQACRPLWRPGLWPLFDGFAGSVFVARHRHGPPGGHVLLRVVHGGGVLRERGGFAPNPASPARGSSRSS